MKITDAFLGEHGVFYAHFDHVQQTAAAVNDLALLQSQATLLLATLGSHAHLEDELLFTTLEPYLGPMGPLAVMRMEHAQIESLLADASAAQSPDQARSLLLQTAQVARSHFAKEEQILYPIALRVLDEEQLLALGAQWAARRGVTA